MRPIQMWVPYIISMCAKWEMWFPPSPSLGLNIVQKALLNHCGDDHPHPGSGSRHAHQLVLRSAWGHAGSIGTSLIILHDK